MTAMIRLATAHVTSFCARDRLPGGRLKVVHRQRAGADQRELASKDVDELRQFI